MSPPASAQFPEHALRQRHTAVLAALAIADEEPQHGAEARLAQGIQQSGQVPVFLISLKAGGVGLNLSAADTVIHFDPWWNPAVEDQATDRAHRLGQTRVVTSYKLIARDTVEEKVLQLQQRKRDIIQAALGGEEEFVKALTWEELQEVLSG